MGVAREYRYDSYNYYKNDNRILKIAEENNEKCKQRERFINKFFTSILYFACILVVFSLAFLLVQRNSLIVKFKTESLNLEREIRLKNLQVENLESDISRNLDLTMIENKATNELNLVYPDLSQTIYIKEKWKYSIKDVDETINSISKINNGVQNEE